MKGEEPSQFIRWGQEQMLMVTRRLCEIFKLEQNVVFSPTWFEIPDIGRKTRPTRGAQRSAGSNSHRDSGRPKQSSGRQRPRIARTHDQNRQFHYFCFLHSLNSRRRRPYPGRFGQHSVLQLVRILEVTPDLFFCSCLLTAYATTKV